MNTSVTIGYIYCGVAVVCAFILFFDAKIIADITPKHSISTYVFWTFISAGISAIFDCAFPLREMEIYVPSQTTSYILTLIYVIFSNLIGMFWILYSERKQKSWFAQSKKNELFLLVPFFIVLLIIISSPITHFYFYFEENHYQRGPLFSGISVLLFVFLVENGVMALIRSFQKKNYVERNEYRRLFLFMVVYIAIQFVQLALPDVFPYRSVGTMLVMNVVLTLNIKEMVGVDPLTRISNRFEAERYLGKMMQDGKPFEAVMIDLDKFKSINDTYGHLEGDKALQYAVDALSKSVPKSCFIARMGGDEFLLVNNDNQNSISDIEDKINENLKTVLDRNKCEYDFTVSVGYALKDNNIDSIPDLIKAADEKLYQRKDAKR